MKDITENIKMLRTATAVATLKVAPKTAQLLLEDKIPGGDPLSVAKIAAIQAAKNNHRIIPFCHPVHVDYTGVDFSIGDTGIDVTATVKAVHKTDVETEAMTAASVAVLTLYDILKTTDGSAEITGVVLTRSRGSHAEYSESALKPLRAAVLVISDSVARGEKSDRSGKLIGERLGQLNIDVREYKIIPDEPEEIKKSLLKFTDENRIDLIITTGGTGMGPRDFTPESMSDIIERQVPGISETMRAYGQDRMPYAMLSRGKAGIRGNSLIINLPGSTRGVMESLDALFPFVLHSFRMMWGREHEPRSSDTGERISGGGSND